MHESVELAMVLKILFWTASFLVLYPYVFYPLLLAAINRIRSRVDALASDDSQLPSVTLVISAFNEEDVISEKIQNSLSLDYPKERLSIVVVSDASDDDTDQVVNDWSLKNDRVKLLRQSDRLGKSSGINAVMKTLDSDIVVFSDANALYEADAVRELVKPFTDSTVGYVVGSALYLEQGKDAVKDSEGLYWKYELMVKKLESSFHSVVGGDGAIYAIRRELFWALGQSDINDFVNPLQIVASGSRGVFSQTARCYEYASDAFKQEFGRKRRIVNRSWRAVCTYWHLFSLRRHAIFLFMLVSHKVIRWLSMLFIVLALFSCMAILLIEPSALYFLCLTGILSTLFLAALGRWLDLRDKTMPRLVYLPYYFYFVNLASILGIWDNSRGVRHVTWGHIRS